MLLFVSSVLYMLRTLEQCISAVKGPNDILSSFSVPGGIETYKTSTIRFEEKIFRRVKIIVFYF